MYILTEKNQAYSINQVYDENALRLIVECDLPQGSTRIQITKRIFDEDNSQEFLEDVSFPINRDSTYDLPDSDWLKENITAVKIFNDVGEFVLKIPEKHYSVSKKVTNFCVLDYSDKDYVDYYFIPLFFLETFTSPAAELKIGKFHIQMPLDWSLLVGELGFGDIEIIPLTSLNSRPFHAFTFNPIAKNGSNKGFIPNFFEVEITMIYPDVKWYMPKLKNANLLAVPLEEGDNPYCVYFCKDVSKIPDSLDVAKLV